MAWTPRTPETGSGANKNVVVTKPSGTVDGDVMDVWIVIEDVPFDAVISSPPAGWVQRATVDDGADFGIRMWLFTKVASGEGASWTFPIVTTAAAPNYTYLANAAAGGDGTLTGTIPSAADRATFVATYTSPSITPAVNGALVRAGFTTDTNADLRPITADTSPAATSDATGFDGTSQQHVYTERFVQATAAAIALDMTFNASCGQHVQTAIIAWAPAGGPTPVTKTLTASYNIADLYPDVVATSVLADTGNATTHNVPLPTPAGGILLNDILLWIGCVDGNTAVSQPGGWTEIKDEASGTACEVYVAWKRAAGGETGNVVLTTGSEAGGHQILCIRGAHLTTAPAISTGVTATSANPNPDSLDPANWATEETLWIAAIGNDANVAVTAGPAGYSGVLNTRWANTAGAGIATAWRQLLAGSEDPGAFTMAAEDSRAFTIAIRPAAAIVPVVQTLTATYNIKKQIPKTLASTFNIRTSVSKSLTASYFLGTTPVSKTLSASYTIRKAIVKTIPSTYFIVKYGPRASLAYYVSPAIGPVQKTLTSTYNIVGRVAKTLSATYNIIKQIPKTLSATYTIRMAITKTLSPSYIIKKSQPKTLSASYNIQKSILKNVTSGYNIIKQIPKTLSATYTIRKSILKTLSASYNIGSTSAVPKTLIASYIIKKSIPKTLSATYMIRVSVAKALASSYTIKVSIIKSLSPSYQIIQFGTVNKTLSAVYSIQRQIAKTISSTYNIKREIPKTVTSSYNIRVSLPKTLTPTYNIKASIAKSLAASYMVRVSATKVLSASYTIKRATPKTLTPTYTIKNSVSQTLTSAYSVIQFGIVTKTLPVSYNIRISVSKSRSSSYMIRRSATKSVTSNYTVIGRIGKTMTAAYIIRTLQIDHFPHSPSGRIAVPSVGRP